MFTTLTTNVYTKDPDLNLPESTYTIGGTDRLTRRTAKKTWRLIPQVHAVIQDRVLLLTRWEPTARRVADAQLSASATTDGVVPRSGADISHAREGKQEPILK